MVSHLCVCPHRLPSLCGFPMSWHSLYIRWLLQLGAVTVFCEIFGEKSQSVTQQGPMTSGCHPCLSRCLETEESEIFGKLQDEFQEITDATRARARVQCPWTVEFLNLYESPFKQCILMEFIPGRNLLEELVVKKSLTVKQIRVYAAEMLACIFSVHRHGYIHSDIKLTNFMLDSYNHIKCATSGSASSFFYLIQCLELYPPHLNFWEVPDTSVLAQWHEIKDTHVQMFSIPHGTSYYCAPEVIKFTYKNWSMYGNNGFTFTCDFWSYGVCLYYLLFGHLPFYSRDKLQAS
ncbi:hypothetical protein C0Q70_15975 [Pomacea canaliculata]|uniref:non-specific serine/threonine protein kinase n=1 Tax=Pomacea canaliculata TaxID=400727 RepID=A0A2T7NNH1_POMCA|nr:hypothetical protein C0Q70_15975 [Pomacea canaliculata]